ncbi:MAG: calcium-binding protein [Magnetospirillum sp.]|nr:calcium-binding protein [Magnetospirillum sp.]
MKWAFPEVTDPVIIDLSKAGGQTSWSFSSTQDVIFIGSDTPRSQLKVDGGRNVVLLGGEFAGNTDSKSATIQIQNVTKAIHIEGVHLDNKNASQDGIAVSGAGSSQPSVTVQNTVIENIHGTQGGVHADMFQTWGPVGDMRFYNVSGDTTYQGFFIAPQYSPGHKSADFENVNVKYGANAGGGTTYQYWFLDGSNETPYPVTLKNVYATERPGQDAVNSSVWPKAGMGAVRVGDQITFTGLPYKGAITVGSPAKDFATTTNTGANFKLDSSDLHIDGSGSSTPSTGTGTSDNGTGSTPTTPPADTGTGTGTDTSTSHATSGAPTHWISSTTPTAKVVGTDGNDQIAGVEGKADVGGLAGGKGDDTYIVDKAGDKVIEAAGQGTDTVVSYAPSYKLDANVENLTIAGTKAAHGMGNDGANILTANDAGNHLDGMKGDDLLVGGKGADVLNGGIGADTMKGGDGNDTYYVSRATDKVVEGSGQGVDTVKTDISYKLGQYVENVELYGSNNVNATGNTWHNVLVGNNGNNVLDGGAGNDRLFGAKGNDKMIGGDGQDTFVLKTAGAGTDTIKDFKLGTDNLDMHNVVKSVGATNVSQAIKDHLLEVVQNGKNAEVIAHAPGHEPAKVAVLENVDAAALLKTSDHWS